MAATLNNIEETEYFKNLTNKIKEYLQDGSEKNKPSQEEIASGMFLHCLIVALEANRAATSGIKILREQAREAEMRTLADSIRALHAHYRLELEVDEDNINRKRQTQAKTAMKKDDVSLVDRYLGLFAMDPASILTTEPENKINASIVTERAQQLVDDWKWIQDNTNSEKRPQSPTTTPKLH